jgi:excisionase family DNA binding protein
MLKAADDLIVEDVERLVMPLWPDAGQALGLSRNATYEAARRGEIPTIRFGRLIKVPTAALRRMLENAGQKPSAQKSHRAWHAP